MPFQVEVHSFGELQELLTGMSPRSHLVLTIEDFDLTKRLFAAGEVIGIHVSDHVVIGRDDYRSIRELRPNSSADGPGDAARSGPDPERNRVRC